MNILETNDFLIDFTFTEEPYIVDDFRLHQVGKKFCGPETVVGTHVHVDWFEITVILDGKGEVYANDKCVPVQQGDLFLSFPCDLHKITSSPNSPVKYSFLSFCFRNDAYKKEFEQITQLFYDADKRVFNEPSITFLIDQIISELLSPAYKKETIISLSLQQIVLLLIRSFLYTQAKPAPKHANKNEILCHKIMQYIDGNIFSIRNLTELSKYLSYNYSYLAKVFKQTTNTTIMQYYAERKLQCAKALIKDGSLTFTEISELLNYASIYSFSKSFKFHFGLSPIEYKRSIKTTHTTTKKRGGSK
jgi:AraC-like DNA-binding protein/mannose-6-phosphate isomerase-like protein (cupin superfamily)